MSMKTHQIGGWLPLVPSSPGLNSSVHEIQRSLLHADVRLHTEEDGILHRAGPSEPGTGCRLFTHAYLYLYVYYVYCICTYIYT